MPLRSATGTDAEINRQDTFADYWERITKRMGHREFPTLSQIRPCAKA